MTRNLKYFCNKSITKLNYHWYLTWIQFTHHYVSGGGYSYGIAHGMPGNIRASLLSGRY